MFDAYHPDLTFEADFLSIFRSSHPFMVHKSRVNGSISEKVRQMEITLKCCVVGLAAVGKSALSLRFVENKFSHEYEPSLQNDYVKKVEVDGHSCTIHILDTAGMDDNEAMKDAIYPQQGAFILVYAINDRRSFETIYDLYESIVRRLNEKKVPYVLCGNKVDLAEEREVSEEEGRELAQQIGATFMETSALNGTGVHEAMTTAIREYAKTLAPAQPTKSSSRSRKGGCLLI